MWKALRISILLLVLLFVSVSTWLTQARSTDWEDSLWIKVYPINGDGSDESRRYIANLDVDDFDDIESFVEREIRKYGHTLSRPVRMELGREILEQPPSVGDAPGALDIMLWSLKIRWWAGRVAGPQDDPAPDVRVFVRYHAPLDSIQLENSVGLRKAVVGVVEAVGGSRWSASHHKIKAPERLPELGAKAM